MGRRKGKKQNPETLTFSQIENELPKIVEVEEAEEDGTGSKGNFFVCYLLTSLCPRFKGQTYIGFTVNPKRRIRQHNGEIGSGAWRTKKKRPWEMVLCIYGFPTNVAALQFEWAWQHPVESLAVRKAAVNFKSLSGLANKIKLAHTMVTLEAWKSLNLTVNFFSTKYQNHIAGCPSLPKQMRVQVCSMDELPFYTGSIEEDDVFLDDAYTSSSDGCLKTADNEEIDEEIDHCLAVRKHSLENSKLGRCNTSQEVTHEPSVCMDEACFSEPRHSPITHEPSVCMDDEACFSEPRHSPITHEPSVCMDEACFSEPRHSPITDTLPPFQLYDECCPLSDKSFSPPRYNDMVNNAEEIGIFKSNCSNEYSQFSNNLRPITIIEDTDTYPPPGMSKAVEVIDLFTPSPCLRVSKANKRRWSSAYPEIIDLTESPVFV